MLTELAVDSFLDRLADGTPAPGGGSVAGMMGAQGAALLSMMCRLTLGRSQYTAVQAEATQALARAEQLRADLLRLVDADAAAFTAVMAALALPKETAAEREERTAAMQRAIEQATLTPLATAAACADILSLCPPLVAQGNRNAISDAGVAVLAAYAGMLAAALNVRTNLNGLKNTALVTQWETEIAAILERGEAARQKAWDALNQRMQPLQA